MKDVDSNSRIFVWHQNQKQGPYSSAAIKGAIDVGKFSPQTPAWTLDNHNWRPLTEVLRELGTENENTPTPLEEASDTDHPLSASPKQGQTSQAGHYTLNTTSHSNFNSYRNITITGISLLLIILLVVSVSKHQTSSSPSGVVRDANTAEKCAVFIEGDQGRGTGSLVWDNGDYYLYTNVHVASMGNLTVTDLRGEIIFIPSVGEVPTDSGVDLVRFKLDDKPDHALLFADRESIEKQGAAFTIGDSAGEGVLRKLTGQVIGVGAQKIEVDCEFISGNSGGPIVNSEGRLLALASYMTKNDSIWAKGTSMEVRRFGWIPSANYDWKKTTSDELYQEAQLIEECMATTRLLIAISYLNTKTAGFEFSQKWPIKHISIPEVLKNSQEHPLSILLVKTDNKLRRYAAADHNLSGSQVKQEYVNFFKQCERYATSELNDAKGIIKSGFWRAEFESKLNTLDEISSDFTKTTKSFEQSDDIGGCLAE